MKRLVLFLLISMICFLSFGFKDFPVSALHREYHILGYQSPATKAGDWTDALQESALDAINNGGHQIIGRGDYDIYPHGISENGPFNVGFASSVVWAFLDTSFSVEGRGIEITRVIVHGDSDYSMFAIPTDLDIKTNFTLSLKNMTIIGPTAKADFASETCPLINYFGVTQSRLTIRLENVDIWNFSNIFRGDGSNIRFEFRNVRMYDQFQMQFDITSGSPGKCDTLTGDFYNCVFGAAGTPERDFGQHGALMGTPAFYMTTSYRYFNWNFVDTWFGGDPSNLRLGRFDLSGNSVIDAYAIQINEPTSDPDDVYGRMAFTNCMFSWGFGGAVMSSADDLHFTGCSFDSLSYGIELSGYESLTTTERQSVFISNCKAYKVTYFLRDQGNPYSIRNIFIDNLDFVADTIKYIYNATYSPNTHLTISNSVFEFLGDSLRNTNYVRLGNQITADQDSAYNNIVNINNTTFKNFNGGGACSFSWLKSININNNSFINCIRDNNDAFMYISYAKEVQINNNNVFLGDTISYFVWLWNFANLSYNGNIVTGPNDEVFWNVAVSPPLTLASASSKGLNFELSGFYSADTLTLNVNDFINCSFNYSKYRIKSEDNDLATIKFYGLKSQKSFEGLEVTLLVVDSLNVTNADNIVPLSDAIKNARYDTTSTNWIDGGSVVKFFRDEIGNKWRMF